MGNFRDLCGLQPTERVLDVGSGTGRMAIPLTTYLTSGTYAGLEIVGESVRWCQRAYGRHPNFRFHHADVRNDRYNPRGQTPASEYRFPFDSGTFDFAFLTSVFTHLLPAATVNDLSEVTRVLRPGGHALITYFLLSDETATLIASGRIAHTFAHEFGCCRVDVPSVAEAAVAFSQTRVREMHAAAGLPVESVRCGAWSGRTDGLSWQDITISIKTISS
ncbi:class I SAM-dependent methyltransferase [Frigoriglobus tundricola]|uniref:Methyltransferase type 11 domain-containing protein n=1 Tax=Frigoriglobus tundricola TaxID=2774151 RepID=A0A6M5Z5D9_9BACT|nr:class I SAM-dependent methyltransferase [Frigoriglobus tundricola]QJX01306.1 hypothetical protein FTUN_8950 [Frigoriglobus tundricola]